MATVTCEAFSYPPAKFTWSRPLTDLAEGRCNIKEGTLTITDFSVGDTGTYICAAHNKVGRKRAFTTLGIQRIPGKYGYIYMIDHEH